MSQVPLTPTPMTLAQGLGALLAAGCPQSALLMVGAQSCVETAGFGSVSGHGFNNFNYGNLTPSAAQLAAGADWWTASTTPGMKYLSFADPVSGAKAMLGWLQSHGLYAPAVANDLTAYMTALAKGCYLGCIGRTDATGHTVSQQDYDSYRAGISTWMQKLSGVTPTPPPSPAPAPAPVAPPSSSGPLMALALVALAGAGAYAYVHRHQLFPSPRPYRLAHENPAPSGGHVQSLLFDRSRGWTPARAHSWALRHGYRTRGEDLTPGFVHLRVAPPGRFARIRTVPFGSSGVQARIGWA